MRTEDPWEANMFYVPALAQAAAGEHLVPSPPCIHAPEALLCTSAARDKCANCKAPFRQCLLLPFQNCGTGSWAAPHCHHWCAAPHPAAGNVGDPSPHLARVVEYIRQTWPFFNRSAGADHFVWLPGDFGACGISDKVGETSASAAVSSEWLKSLLAAHQPAASGS